jgi:hypothetical protein
MDEDNLVSLAKGQKKNLMERLNIARSTYNKYMLILKHKTILLRQEHNLYMFNPNFFVKSKWDNVRKLRNCFYEISISYDTDTGERIVSSSVKRKRKSSKSKKQIKTTRLKK